MQEFPRNHRSSITGADDYAEVATLQGRHLVRLSLSEFEKSLDGDRFIRVLFLGVVLALVARLGWDLLR